MKIKSITKVDTLQPISVIDCFVGDGYRQGIGGQLADVDIDYQSDRRQEIKEYLEHRYNVGDKQRVFSAGTYTTLKLKAVLKDVSRVHKVPLNIVNYITAIFGNDTMSWTDLFKLAATNKRVNSFIQSYPQVIEDIRALMGQPRSASVHASAIIITPSTKEGRAMECFDYTPIKKVDGVLVSELDGYSIDEVGLLKNDCLGIKELTKIQAVIQEVNEVYNDDITFEDLVTGDLNDSESYELLSSGYTQNIFQLSSRGMTRFLMDMRPSNINDLIAANALYRPATLESGSLEKYLDCKMGNVAPVYLWGTHNALKETYGQLCIAEDSVVQTKEGNKKIQEIRYGDYVLTEDGSYQFVSSAMCKGSKETIKIHTSHGEDLICTKDHKVLTQHGWVKANDLIPRKHLIKGFWAFEENTDVGTLKDWCLGIYLANGNYGSGTPTIACRDKDAAEVTAKVFNECFQLDSVIYFHTRCWYVRLTYKRGGTNQCTPNPFTSYLRFLGLNDCLSYDKFIPTKPSLMLISGLIEGDGCIETGCIRLINRLLAKQIFYALQSFRIPSNYFETYENGQWIHTVSYRDNSTKRLRYQFKTHGAEAKIRSCGCLVPSVYLNSINLKSLPKRKREYFKSRIRKLVPCYLETVLTNGGECDHQVWGLVLSIKPDTVRRTYDLSVENNHSFCVGGLIVHNCYQEQVSQLGREVGGFSLGDGVNLVKLISKKRTDKILAMKGRFMSGAESKGCPKEDAIQIWKYIEMSGSYLFNKSHSTAYAVTAYVGAYLKTNYPTAFYSIALEWADDKEIPTLMSEMEQCSVAKIVPPNINVSQVSFFTDYKTDEIFWSLTRIKMLGAKSVEYIIDERNESGEFTSIENFIRRIFRYKLKRYEYWNDPDNAEEAVRVPVNARHIKHMILAGCFDTVEGVTDTTQRYAILERATKELGFTLKESEFPTNLVDKPYFWSMQQIAISGVGSIDYRGIYDSSDAKKQIKGKVSYLTLKDTADLDNDGRRVAICATVTEFTECSYKDKVSGERKKFAKITLQQNNDLMELIFWSDYYEHHQSKISTLKDQVIIVTAIIKYSDYNGANNLSTYKTSLLFKL